MNARARATRRAARRGTIPRAAVGRPAGSCLNITMVHSRHRVRVRRTPLLRGPASRKWEPPDGEVTFSFVRNDKLYVRVSRVLPVRYHRWGWPEPEYSETIEADQFLLLQQFDLSSAQWSGVSPVCVWTTSKRNIASGQSTLIMKACAAPCWVTVPTYSVGPGSIRVLCARVELGDNDLAKTRAQE